MAETLLNLALALAAGLIVGMERGWQERTATEGSRIAGIRTFGLVGLLGGFWELLTAGNGVAFGLAYLALALVMAIAHYAESKADRDYGITTIIAALITFLLGALAARGQHAIAAAGAVVVAALLSLKPVLHRWLERIESTEVHAALKLLLISVVVLPILPNQGYGPWESLNPYALWSLVVVIAAISFAAYIVIKIAGPERGILLTGLLGGLVSSTAVTLQLARLSRTAERKNLFAAGTLVACATMFVRVVIVVTIVNRDLWPVLRWPALIMALPMAGAAMFLAQRSEGAAAKPLELRNPVEIGQAVRFGALLAAILVISRAMREVWGYSGIYLVAAVAGVADVDAISISAARMTATGLDVQTAAQATILAAMVNTVTKGLLAGSIGGRAMGIRVLVPMAISLIAGGLALVAF